MARHLDPKASSRAHNALVLLSLLLSLLLGTVLGLAFVWGRLTA